MWEQPKECVCSVPATLIQQTSFRATQVLSSCQSVFHSPSSLGCPPRLSWKSLCREAEWSRGYHQRERRQVCNHSGRLASWQCADVVHRFSDQPSLCPYTASARQGRPCCPCGASSRGRQSHWQSSLPPDSASLHLIQSYSTASSLHTPSATSTNTLQYRGLQLKDPKGVIIPQRQSFTLQGPPCCKLGQRALW